MIKGQNTTGTALLLAAAPTGKSRLINATGVLPTLAAVPPSTLTGTPAGTIVELADPMDQQTVLTRVRAAAATPGPLSLLVTGQLQLDARQRRLHLALARSTPATLRYTGLPWDWLVGELKPRLPDSTRVIVDLVAAPDAWPEISAYGLTLGPGIALHGRVAPPPARNRPAAEPSYLQAVATLWRSGLNPPPGELHARAAAQAGHDGALFLSVDGAPAPVAVPLAAMTPAAMAPAAMDPPAVAPAAPAEDALPAILSLAHVGRHGEAAAHAVQWERWAVRTHGAGSVEAVHWLEVRADLAHVSGDAQASCELWMAAADARLALHEAPDSAGVQAAVDRAHHQWQQLRDPGRAAELGPRLASLRGRVPGRPGASEAVRRRLEFLRTGALTAGQ
ncbi:hypothetical protein ACFXD5_03410 [Streptomyces sp. NPDC059385]|uniref:hypothetical protein n=1 Tax=Streptomyces sp. NPDC059385 TaxID=3346817 RepID=UPI00367A8A1D